MGNVLIQGKRVTDRTKVQEIEVDASGSLIAITHEHSKVHQGRFFSAGYYSASVADGSSINFMIQTPSDTDLHTHIKLAAGGDAVFYAFEDTTFSAAGTTITPVNHDRTSSNVDTSTVTHSPTITDDGTQLWEEFMAGGSGFVTIGATQGVSSEQFILAANTTYLFRLTNDAGTSQPLQIMTAYYGVPV